MKSRIKKEMIIIILVFAALLMIFLISRIGNKDGKFAVITVDGVLYGKYPLSKDADIPIERDGVVINRVAIENSGVYMKDASCRNHICVSMGKKKADGESIVCLPNRVVIRIEGGSEEEYYDVITD